MPIQLPIYSPGSPLDLAKGAPPSSTCSACELGTFSGVSPCIPPEGGTGGWLVVTDHPTEADNATRMPLSGQAGKMVRAILARDLPGRPMAFVSAVNCATTPDAVDDEHVDACRQYVKHAIELVKPRLILCMGSKAALSITGFASDPASVIGGYAFIPHHTKADRPLPVFFGPTPFNIARNRVIRDQFRQLLNTINNWKWSPAHGAHFGATTLVVQSGDDALSVRARILASGQERYAEGSGKATASVDVETWYPAFQGQRVVSLALSWYEGGKVQSAVWDTEGLDPMGEALWVLNEILQDPRIDKVMHNGKFDQHALHSDPHLVPARPYVGDTRLLAKLLNPNASAALDSCAVLVGMGGHKNEARSALEAVKKDLSKYVTSLTPTRTGKLRPAYVPTTLDPATIPQELIKGLLDKTAEIESWAYNWLPQDVRIRYNALDTAATIKLWVDKRDEMSPGQRMVFEEVVMPATQALVQMEEWGLPVDIGMLDLLEGHIAMSFKPVKDRLDQYGAPEVPFNPGSRPQVIALLQKLKLNPRGTTASGAISVDDKSLEPLRKKHPVVNDILEYRRLVKMQSTYVDGVRSSVCADGKIHATCLLDGTGTGRASYQRPNLQNWPRAVPDPLKPEGKMLRDCVVAPPGWLIVETDQSQVEIRVAAALSGDPEMLKIINEGRDFHGATAEMIYGPEFTDEQRTASKITNFSLIYEIPENIGYMLSKSLSAATGREISKQEAQEIADKIFGRYKRLRAWMHEQHMAGISAGGTYTTWRGEPARFRPLPDLGLVDDPQYKGMKDTAIRSTWNCVDAKTEALTQRGWVSGFDLRRDDVLLTKNAATGELEWQGMTDLKLFPNVHGTFTEIRSRSFSSISTQDHRWLIHNSDTGRDECRMTKDIKPTGSHKIHRTGEYLGPTECQHSADFVRLCGWFLTDGTLRFIPRERSPDKTQVTLCQSARANPHKVELITQLLERMGISAHLWLCPRDQVAYWSLPQDISERLAGLFPTRTLTMQFLCSLPRSSLEILRETMMLGDGTRDHERFSAGTLEKAEMFQVLLTLCGRASVHTSRDMSSYAPTSSKMHNIPKMGTIQLVSALKRKYVQVLPGQTRTYEGVESVWCPIVPNTYFVARREGQVYITGNTPVQGVASDLTTSSLWPIVSWVLEEKAPAKVLVTIHDSIVAVVREDWMDRYITKVKEVMTQHQGWLGVTLAADAKVGQRWGQMTKYKKETT